MIVAFLGKAGVGKDTAADYLCKKYDFTKVAFADPMKRFCQEIFDFTYEQLWGPSEMRNKPDERYPQSRTRTIGDPPGEWVTDYLTPRFALQTLGTEWGRGCYRHVWVDYAMRVAKRLLEGNVSYSPDEGLHYEDGLMIKQTKGVVISDARFKNELSRIREQGAKVVQLVRRRIGDLTAGVQRHASETEQESVTEADVDSILHVPEGHENYYAALDKLMETFQKGKD
jgi:hypothetical protein